MGGFSLCIKEENVEGGEEHKRTNIYLALSLSGSLYMLSLEKLRLD